MMNVFLSSSVKDLAPYREAAYRAIQGLEGYHCVRMEDFGAVDRQADDFCRGKIGECQLFVGIVGHLYGSCPAGSDYRRARAWAADQINDYRQVEADLTRVLKLMRPTAEILSERGSAFFALREYGRAEEDQTQALKIDPKYRQAWAVRGEARARMGRWVEAIKDYSQALRLDDKRPLTWRLRGVAHAELGGRRPLPISPRLPSGRRPARTTCPTWPLRTLAVAIFRPTAAPASACTSALGTPTSPASGTACAGFAA
jgi:tetratricopeptide (TPR) repeat protein